VHEQEWRNPFYGLSVYLAEIRPGSITNFNWLLQAVEQRWAKTRPHTFDSDVRFLPNRSPTSFTLLR
jgi:hypothetical protein